MQDHMLHILKERLRSWTVGCSTVIPSLKCCVVLFNGPLVRKGMREGSPVIAAAMSDGRREMRKKLNYNANMKPDNIKTASNMGKSPSRMVTRTRRTRIAFWQKRERERMRNLDRRRSSPVEGRRRGQDHWPLWFWSMCGGV